MLFNVIGFSNEILGQVEAEDAVQARIKAEELPGWKGNVLDVRMATPGLQPITPKQRFEGDFFEQVERIVKSRGQKAVDLWTMAGGYLPGLSVSVVLDNLKRVLPIIHPDYLDTANVLINDLEEFISL